MANNSSAQTDLAYADTLWKSADALRGQVDAAEYKHVVLGLLFLKYVSDSFAARREELKKELESDGITGPQLESLLENRDEYTAERVFWVPPEARWANLQNQATRPEIATLIDDAILAVERDNPNLKSKLPRDYARRGIAPEKLKGLIDLIANIGFKGDRAKARDSLGRSHPRWRARLSATAGRARSSMRFAPPGPAASACRRPVPLPDHSDANHRWRAVARRRLPARRRPP
jgi:type I restriction enzyme M protein